MSCLVGSDGDSRYQLFFFMMSLLGKIKNFANPMSGPQVLLETVLVCETEEPGNHCSEGKGRSRPHTEPQDSNTNVTERLVTQRLGHRHAAHPTTPASLSGGPPRRDHVTPNMRGVVPWLENIWDHSEASS